MGCGGWDRLGCPPTPAHPTRGRGSVVFVVGAVGSLCLRKERFEKQAVKPVA